MHIIYWSTETWGFEAQESIHLADVTVHSHTFANTYAVEGWLWPEDSSPISVLGLAREPYHTMYSNLSSMNSFQRMLADNLLERQLFSLRLPQSVNEDGELLFGAVNQSLLGGNEAVLNVTGHYIDPGQEWLFGGWQVQAHAAAFGTNISVDLSNMTAIYSTIAPLISIPQRMLDEFEVLLGEDSTLDVHCDKRMVLPDFKIVLGSGSHTFSFVLTPWDYILANPNRPYGCESIFAATNEESDVE